MILSSFVLYLLPFLLITLNYCNISTTLLTRWTMGWVEIIH